MPSRGDRSPTIAKHPLEEVIPLRECSWGYRERGLLTFQRKEWIGKKYLQEEKMDNRKPGGQPGNWNAFKHGFYSRRYKPLELQDLGEVLSSGLSDEIALLRVIIRRVFEFASESDEQGLETWTHALNTLGRASTRLAGLLRTQHTLCGEEEDIVDTLSKALGQVAHEIGFRDPTAH